MKKFIIRFSLLLGVIGIILLFFIPLMKDIKYGLDLQGGFEVLYEVSPLEGDNLTRDMLTATYKTISKRIDVLGVMEPDIIIEGDSRIRVRLAGVTNREEARDVLSKAASLSFRDTKDNLLMTSSVLKAGSVKTTADDRGTPAVLLPIKDVDKFYNVTNKVKDYEDNRIVIFDRIREIIKTKHKGIVPDKEVLKGIVNDSLRSTLTRTIFTTTTVLFPIISLIFLGAYEINNFNIAILIGLIAGVYSTVFLAPQLWYTMELKNVGKKAEDKKIYKDEFEEINIKGINS